MTEEIKGMIVGRDRNYAVMTDPDNGHYGWLFQKHPDGMWVSLRKALPAEMQQALTGKGMLDFMDKAGIPHPAPPKQGTLFTCIGKGGCYEDMGVAIGAGTSKGDLVQVYRDTATGQLYFREPENFIDRMEVIK
jgi:hypothetical protein